MGWLAQHDGSSSSSSLKYIKLKSHPNTWCMNLTDNNYDVSNNITYYYLWLNKPLIYKINPPSNWIVNLFKYS